jgi:hypothetical protein
MDLVPSGPNIQVSTNFWTRLTGIPTFEVKHGKYHHDPERAQTLLDSLHPIGWSAAGLGHVGKHRRKIQMHCYRIASRKQYYRQGYKNTSAQLMYVVFRHFLHVTVI